MTVSDDQLLVPQGTFTLRRHPPVRDPSLRAWDAADSYVARYVAGEEVTGIPTWREPPEGHWVVVDHRAGALAVLLHGRRPTLWSDSSLTHEGARRNLAANGLDHDVVTTLPSTQDPTGPVAVALIKIPKTLAQLEELLGRLRPALVPGAVVLGAAMTKDVHTSTIDTFATVVGPTVTSHAWKKARLLHATVDPDLTVAPRATATAVEVAEGIPAVARPGVFAGEKLDQGTGLLLASIPWRSLTRVSDVVDLGCGSGVLGTVAASELPDATVTFVDESYAAVASATDTFAASHGPRPCQGLVDDAGTSLEADSVDLVLCNPPFHSQGARGDDVAWRMFSAARRALRHGGTLFVVGNRHLGYHASLARVFDDVEVVGNDPKFVVLRASGSRPT